MLNDAIYLADNNLYKEYNLSMPRGELMAEKEREVLSKVIRKMSQDEIIDLLSYLTLRIGHLEMLFSVLLKKKVISKEELDKYKPLLRSNLSKWEKFTERRSKLKL
jgi:hypothetical protein